MRILRVVGSGKLPCGCLVGVYETFSGTTVRIVDHPGDHCVLGHRNGTAIAGGATRQSVPPPAGDRQDGASTR